MYSFLSQNIPMFPLYMLVARKIGTGLEVLALVNFGPKSHTRKIENIHKDM